MCDETAATSIEIKESAVLEDDLLLSTDHIQDDDGDGEVSEVPLLGRDSLQMPSYRLRNLNHESSSEDEDSDCNQKHRAMRDKLDKARTELSTRMDDVRALKRMVSDTKETIECQRRQRLMQEIRNST